jgi:dTDP-4-dehydrorhamnose 3,5-epimerase
VKFTPLEVDGVHLVELERREDERGWFARGFAEEEFAAHGLIDEIAHCNISFNHRAGTVRGLHLSLPGHPESKFIRCTRGAIVDVAVDVRPDSPTYLKRVQVELSAENGAALYLPPHLAHAYQTLTDDTEVLYMVSVPYAPGAEVGYRHDDPAFGITWPTAVTVVSEKDTAWPAFDHEANRALFAAGVPA